MGRGTNRRVTFSGERFGGDLAGPVPEEFRWLAAQRTIAGVRELTAGGALAALVDRAAHGARIAGVADPVQDDLRDSPLAGIGFHPGLIIDGLGQTVQRPAIVHCRAAKGGGLDPMGRRGRIIE